VRVITARLARVQRAFPLIAVFAVALVVAACGSSSNGSSSAGSSTAGSSTAGSSSAASSSAASSSAASGSAGSSSATPITFAGLFDLSGQLASFGKYSEQGLQLAADQVNGEGGFTVAGHKYKIKLDIADGRTDPTASVAAVRNFLQNGDKFLFGPDTDATSLQVLGVLKGSGVLQFLGGAADQTLIGHAGYTTAFGVVTPNALWEGNVVPVLKRLKIASGSKVAILYPDDTAGNAAAPQFSKILQAAGYKPSTYLFPATTTDFRSLVSRAAAQHPAAILEGYSSQWGLPITQAAVQLKAAKAVVGVVQTAQDVPLTIAKSSGGTFPLAWGDLAADQQAQDPTTSGMKTMRQTWIKYFHTAPTADNSTIAVWFYDAALNAVAGMEKAGTVTDTTAIAKAIRSLTFKGAETIHYTSQNLPVHGTDYGILFGGAQRYYYAPPPSGGASQ
jgi:branched-chain amino acid transport system substrate-binding protein